MSKKTYEGQGLRLSTKHSKNLVHNRDYEYYYYSSISLIKIHSFK